ncbi:betaine-aldehyde dehydrogenase [Thermocatellispora tengchongensis]|uniref:aldehyde dehydrogenase (NAD(+)) n=1 Tax=Thermocatellispora tengchongensis TaxID=1073253 RepID=A0A840PKI3_9ACTN|nr:aldehyde dehydrogenase [Thermocatellispora tengchongensis]MBB5138423.1 betaine-aldehyde dehydrogenase [Thermocatellispora tengchongensis]
MSSRRSESADRRREAIYIDGEWVASTGPLRDVVSPASLEVIGCAPDGTAADMDRAVAAARRAFDEGSWSGLPVTERLRYLERASELYAARAGELAELITAEMGSPITFSRQAQGPIAQHILTYFIRLGKRFEFEQARTGLSLPALVVHDPSGVVAAIAPWNYPQALLLMKIAPALVAGCTVVAKPSPETAIDGLVLAEIFDEAGLPPGVLNVVSADREAGEHLISHPGVDRVAFTGSTQAGRRIAEICGRDLRRCTLELGGKSAALILDDADVALTMAGLRDYAFRNSGQTCTNQTRILVPRSRREEFTDALCAMVSSMAVGDPADPATEIGPLVSERQRDRVEGYVDIGRKEGARVAVGGGRPVGLDVGWYVEPTVFVDVDNSMRIAREEIFGPVVGVIPYDDDAEGIAIANDSDYGLAASVWGGDPERAAGVAKRLKAGMLLVNGQGGSFDAPFGGFRQSGIGRECGIEGLLAYTEPKQLPLL